MNDRAGDRVRVAWLTALLPAHWAVHSHYLSLQLGQSKHEEVKGLGSMRTECPNLWLNLMEALKMQHAENSTLCVVGKFFHHIRMRPGQSHRLLSLASGIAAVLLCRRAVAAGSQIQVEKGTDSGNFWLASLKSWMWFLLPFHCYCCSFLKIFFFWISHEGLWSLYLNISNEKK